MPFITFGTGRRRRRFFGPRRRRGMGPFGFIFLTVFLLIFGLFLFMIFKNTNNNNQDNYQDNNYYQHSQQKQQKKKGCTYQEQVQPMYNCLANNFNPNRFN